MKKSEIEKQINQFNEAHKPFFIMGFEKGIYGLSLMLSFLQNEYKNYCQKAFDTYAREIENDEYDRGNGYDWEVAFHKAFENEPNLKLINFDCESGGFHIFCQDLSILTDFGHRFKEICEDTEKFTPIVFAALDGEEEYEQSKQKLERSIRKRLLVHPMAKHDIITPDGHFFVDSGMGRFLIDGTQPTITSKCGTITLDTEDFLSLKISDMQRDPIDRMHYIYSVEPEPTHEMTIKM